MSRTPCNAIADHQGATDPWLKTPDVGSWSMLLLGFTHHIHSLAQGYPISSVYLHIQSPAASCLANECLYYGHSLPLIQCSVKQAFTHLFGSVGVVYPLTAPNSLQ